MGNWFGKIILSKVIYPFYHDHDHDHNDGQRTKTTTISTGSTSTTLRIKVRMTAKQLKDLAAQVDMSKDTRNSELGRLILQHCLEGKLLSTSSPVVVDHGLLSKTRRDRSALSIIHED